MIKSVATSESCEKLIQSWELFCFTNCFLTKAQHNFPVPEHLFCHSSSRQEVARLSGHRQRWADITSKKMEKFQDLHVLRSVQRTLYTWRSWWTFPHKLHYAYEMSVLQRGKFCRLSIKALKNPENMQETVCWLQAQADVEILHLKYQLNVLAWKR